MWIFAFLLGLAAGSVNPLLNDSGFADAKAWRLISQRTEIAPHGWVEGRSLALSGNGNAAAYGGWERELDGITPGAWYRLTADYRCSGIDYERLHVLARLDWQKATSGRVGQPEYGTRVEANGGLSRLVLEAPAPEGSARVKVQLLMGNAAQGVVRWDRVRLEKIDAPTARIVRVASVRFKPKGLKSAEENLSRFVETVRSQVQRADMVVLPEAITMVGTGKGYVDVAETVPGPSTRVLGDLARSLGSYVVAGLMEREGAVAYNTAVLIDRKGALAGKYRKVYLPREEVEGGLTPGESYPVFDTDFGRLGLMICWDVQYPDAARALALGGAELIAMPIAGGNTTLGHARAIENHLFLVSSGYDYPTEIVDPNGQTVASAGTMPGVATAEIDLGRRYVDAWLGNMRARFFHEIREDVPVSRR